MKRIYELDETELLALSDEDVKKYVDYECALEGVPMLPPSPGIKPSKDAPAPDAQVYSIAGFLTLDAEHAARILAALESGKLFTESYANNDYGTKFLESIAGDSYHSPKIESRRIHSPEQWDRIKDVQSEFVTKLKAWEKVNSDYDKALSERKKISDNVWDKINEARDHSYERDSLRREFVRYLELAEGNHQIALNFLKKVKDLSDFPELVEEFCPQVEEGVEKQ